MAPAKYIYGNWKMFGTGTALPELVAIAKAAAAHPEVDCGVAVPFTLIDRASKAVPDFKIGAQDTHWRDEGPHTGNSSIPMIQEAGGRFVIVGHSERRAENREISPEIVHKAAAAIRHNMPVIICVGETRDERDAGRALDVVQTRLLKSVPAVGDTRLLIVAYEPRWAIGTGVTPTDEEITDVHAMIRARLRDRFGEDGRFIPILYGGSVTGENAARILSIPEVNGALVGGASLSAAKFAPIIAAAAEVAGGGADQDRASAGA